MAGAAAYYLAVCTSFSPWGFSDTATYFTSARNLANGTGFGTVNADGSFTPLQVFAPFFPIVLSLFAKFGADLIVTTRILDIIFFAVLIISCGWIFYCISESAMLSFFFALLVATTPALMTDYSSMMSEPLAIVLGLPAFLLLLLSIKQNSRKWMIFAALLSGLALMTRYAFAAIPVTGVIVLLLLSTTPWRRRILDALIYGLFGLLPMLLWMLQQFITNARIGSLHYSVGFSLKEKLVEFASQVINVMKYWVPYRTGLIPQVSATVFSPILLLLLGVLIAAGVILSTRQRKAEGRQRAPWILISGFVLLLIVYSMVLLATYIFFVESPSLNDRMLSPMAPMVYAILMASSLIVDHKLHAKFSFPLVGALVTLLFVVFNFVPMRTYLINVSTYPDGYTSPEWKGKPILTEVERLPASSPILSNVPDILLFYTNRNAYYLSQADVAQGLTVTVNDLERLKKLMSEDCGALVLFNPVKADAYEQRPDPISEKDVADLSALFTYIYEGQEGRILIDQECIKNQSLMR